jgi:hypothetical protein
MKQDIVVLEAASKTQLGPFTPKIGRTNKIVITSMICAYISLRSTSSYMSRFKNVFV